MQTHTGGKSYSCEVYSPAFSDKLCLVNYMKTHIGQKHVGAKLYFGAMCKDTFSKFIFATPCSNTHRQMSYYCQVCRSGFANVMDVKTNIFTCNRKYSWKPVMYFEIH